MSCRKQNVTALELPVQYKRSLWLHDQTLRPDGLATALANFIILTEFLNLSAFLICKVGS